jgi:hypothetical protein
MVCTAPRPDFNTGQKLEIDQVQDLLKSEQANWKGLDVKIHISMLGFDQFISFLTC